MTKLKPCAHCGSNNIELRRTFDGLILWHVECMDCGVRTMDYPERVNCDFDQATNEMNEAVSCSINAWNTRADSCDDDHASDSHVDWSLDEAFMKRVKDLFYRILDMDDDKRGDKA